MSNSVLCQDFIVTLISATDVEEVRKHFKTKLYAKVKVGNMEAKTETDKKHKTNPEWNTTKKYTIAATDVQNPSGLILEIEICLDSTLRFDQRVGYAKQNIHQLFCHGLDNMKAGLITSLTLPLVHGSGVIKGEVKIEYIFGEAKYVKKLSLAKKVVNVGTSVAVKTVVLSTTGIHIPIPIHVFHAQEIVNGGSSSSGESLVEFIVEGVQNLL